MHASKERDINKNFFVEGVRTYYAYGGISYSLILSVGTQKGHSFFFLKGEEKENKGIEGQWEGRTGRQESPLNFQARPFLGSYRHFFLCN